MRKSSNKYMYFIALLLFVGGVSYLMYTGFSEDSVYFLNVAEVLAMPKDKVKAARLFGSVSPKNLAYSEDRRSVSFALEDKDDPSKTILVNYVGVIPDTFKSESEVIVEGTLDAQGVFQAKTLMTKCPSRYEKENRTVAAAKL